MHHPHQHFHPTRPPALGRRYAVLGVGLLIMAFGIAFSIQGALGTSPISSIPYVLSLNAPLSLGQFTILFNLLIVLVQLPILKKQFQWEHWLQVPVTLLFGWFIDLTMVPLAAIAPQTYLWKLGFLLLGCLILGVNQHFTGKRKSFTTVTGKSGQVSLVKLRKANWPISIVLIVFTAFFAIMPLISFALESVIRQPGNYSLSNMTLHFWIGTEDSAYETGMIAGILLNTTMWSALLRQVLLALVVAAIVGTCGMLIGYACVRRRGSRLSRMVESLAFFPYLMPAMAFATIYLAVATSANFKFLYGTFGVLVLVASIKFLPFASRSGVNSMMQIAPEIEEAAVIFGVPWRTRMTRILFPIQKSSIISGYLLPVISVMREVALFTLLVPYARYLLTTMLFSFNETGYAQYGSAVTLLIILIIILINFVTNKLTGASFDKGIGG